MLKRLNNILALLIIFIVQGFFSIVEASPWLETNDPFLRSDLVALSDAGLLDSPIDHYPLRWAMIGDKLEAASVKLAPSTDLERAAKHLNYALASAKFGRGNRSIKMVYGSDTPLSAGFGQFSQDEWGITSSYETLQNSFAFRVTTGYSKYNDDEDFRWNDSYLSFNAGAWLFSAGNLDRWWGPSWQHNLILGSYARANPDLSVSYIGQNKLMGSWSVESIIAFPEDATTDYHNAVRLVSKPLSFFEVGTTYQRWFDEWNFSDDDQQIAVDAKLTLPAINRLYHSIYGELASTSTISKVGVWLIGWSGQFDIAKQTIRIVLEKQDSTSEKDKQSWNSSNYPSYSDNIAKTTYELDNSVSAAIYLQLENDHNISVIIQESEESGETVKSTQVNYQLPAFAGMLHFGASNVDNETSNNETNIWTGYEFRF